MTNKYEDIIRKGLPGGPNEEITYTSGFSTMGYKRFSPDVNNPFNIIPSGRITMEDVDFPVTGIDDLGNESIMFPGEEYSFPGNMVLELPHKEHRNVEAHGNAFGDNNVIGYSGHLNSKNIDVHGTYIKPLQNIAARNGMLDLGLDLKYQRGDNEFSLSPHAHLGKHPQFGVSVGYKRSFQDGGEKNSQGVVNLNDLYISPSDLEYLNNNEYYECKPGEVGCLASSYDAYDKLVGQRYRSDEFLNEQGLKKSLGLQSLQSYNDSNNGTGYDYDKDADEFVYYKDHEIDRRFGKGSTTYDWIKKQGDYFKAGKGSDEHYDFTADSWDIHGLLTDQGGKSLYTLSDKQYKKNKEKGTLTKSQLEDLYSQMAPGTIIGYDAYLDRQGANHAKGMASSGHSTQVVGYDERGVPVIFDYGSYIPIDQAGEISNITNITIPKEHIGKGLDWAKEKGYYTGKDPQALDLNLEPILSQWGQDDDELPDFYNAMRENKYELMNDLNMKEGVYDEMAAALIGIAMQETEGGGGWQHNIEQAIPGVMGQDTSGLTQLMWSNISEDKKLKKIAKKYGITKQSDLKDADKSAIASMIYGSRNYLAAQKNLNKGMEEGVRTYRPPNWKGKLKDWKSDITYDGKEFITESGIKVDFFSGINSLGLGSMDDLEEIQKSLDEAAEAEGTPGRYTARFEKDEDGEEQLLIDKKTFGNSKMDPMDAFIYNWNSPYSLTSGDAQGSSAYLKNVKGYMDMVKKQYGGTVEGPVAQEEFDQDYHDGMTAMMKARLAYEEMHGNPAAERMVAPTDNPYDFGDGRTGTHYMASYDNYAIPNIQIVDGILQMTGPRADEEMRFDREEDARYFADENYKRVSPAFQQNGGQIPRAQDGMEIVVDQMIEQGNEKRDKANAIPEPTQAYLNDLYISDEDLKLLNARPENIQYEDLTETDKNKKYYSNAHDKKISAKEYQDYYGGFDFYDLSNEGQKEANPYFCDPSKGCLASAFDSYDELVGQRYRAQDFMTEAKLKKALDLQSLPRGYEAVYDKQGNLTFEDSKGNPVSQRTHDWIMSQGDYFKQGKHKIYAGFDEDTRKNIYAKNPDGSFKYGDKYDFTADSWDIHSVIKNKGGKNIFTKNPKDYEKGDYDEYSDRYNLGEYKGKTMADLSERELKNIYSQITPGTIIGFGHNNAGSNEKDGMAGSTHSAIVVGFDKRGVPIIYDYGNYVALDGETMYGFDGVSNISVPKQMKGKNLEWAKDQGMYSGKDPKGLDLQINNIVEAGGDEDEIVPFYEALKENKNSLMNDLKIRPKNYDMFSKLLIGISMEETTGGSGIQHNIEQMIPGTPGQESVGLTQLMWSNIEGDDKLKKIAKKYNIDDIGDLKDPKKSAIASMIYASRNMSSAKKNYRKGKGQKGLRTYYPATGFKASVKALKSDPTFDGYTFLTEERDENGDRYEVDFFTGNNWSGVGWDKDIEDIQSQFDEIAPGKYTVREEDGEYVVDKVTEGNSELTPEQMFIYNWNSPNTLLKGDAQGGATYVNRALGYYDQLQSGGEISSEDIEAKQQALQEELANLDAFQLQPAQLLKMQTQLYDTYNENVPRKFRVGGPKLSPELKLYKDYIVGKDESQEAQKNYDKLNRVYYREAKVNNMHPSNYIMTTMIS